MEKLFKNQGKRQLLEGGVRLRYFFILLLRPSTRFFPNQLYEKYIRLPFLWTSTPKWSLSTSSMKAFITRASVPGSGKDALSRVSSFMALGQSNVRWFGTCSRKSAPRGFLSSLIQPQDALSPTSPRSEIIPEVNGYWWKSCIPIEGLRTRGPPFRTPERQGSRADSLPAIVPQGLLLRGNLWGRIITPWGPVRGDGQGIIVPYPGTYFLLDRIKSTWYPWKTRGEPPALAILTGGSSRRTRGIRSRICQ